MHFIFVDENLIEIYFYNDLQLAKKLRVNTQYYTTDDININKIKIDSEKARDFVLKIEETIENITNDDIKKIILKLNKI